MTINRFAGMGGHQSAKSGTNAWLTPPALIEATGGWQSYDLDPCASIDQPLPTARRSYTELDNGLLLPWHGRVWLNPPYEIELLSQFLGRMAVHNRGIALIFARTETDPFHRFVWQAATALLFLRGRLNFHFPDGARSDENAGAPSVLIAYGDEDRDILAAAPIEGAFVPLRLPTSMMVVIPENTSWAEALAEFFSKHPEPVALADLYRAFNDHPKTRTNQFWRDKLRQMLQRGQYERVEKGLWRRLDEVAQTDLLDA